MSLSPLGGNSSRPSVSSSSVSSGAQTLKNLSPEFKSILTALNIDPSKVSHTTKQVGGNILETIQKSVQEIQVIHITHEHAEALKGLGLVGFELALVINTGDDLANIKKKLKKVQESMMDKTSLSQLTEALGLPSETEPLVMTDNQGGIMIIRSFVEEVEASIEE